MSRILLAITLLLLAGCASVAERSAERATAPPPPGFKLPAPSTLRDASFTPGERSVTADQYETAFPNSRVQVSGTSLQFTADSAMASPADLAFAMYELDGTGYSGQGLLGIDWQGGAPVHGVYIGLANWVTNSWEWQLTPVAEEIDLGIYTQYVDSVTGHILITVLSTRIQTMTLDEVYFGTPGLEPPTNVQATDGDFPDKITITWDAPVDGPTPTGYSIWRSDDIMPRNYAEIDTVAFTTTYDDTAVVADIKYWYRVKSTKSGEAHSALSSGENDGMATAGGLGWTITSAAPIGQPTDPIYLSLALVNGNPAVSWNRNASNYPIYYRRAQDTAGTLWGAAIENITTTRLQPSLGFSGGLPGIAYQGPMGAGDMWYVHGSDADGGAWDNEVVAHNPPSGYVISNPDMLTIEGRPAIAFKYSDFVNSTGTELCYIRASDTTGDSWPANRIVVDSGERANNPQMAILSNGNPAILYSETDNQLNDPADLLYVKATNNVGSAWDPPTKLYDFANANDLPFLQLIVANGNPAAVFHDPGTDDLYFKRATSIDGSSWPLGATKIADDIDFYDGAATVNGKPAVSYVTDGGSDVVYREAIDTSGNSWLPAEPIEDHAGGAGLATLKGFGSPQQHACVAFRVNGADIRYARKN